MENTRDALAGVVAEFWCIPWLATNYKNILPHEFGGYLDRVNKVDYFAVEENGADYLLDTKASIEHPNILIETDHPAFSPGNLARGHRGFVLPFKDFPEILVVRSTIWFKHLLEQRAEKKTFSSREVYVVTRDVIVRSYHSPRNVKTIATDESFGHFFDRNYPFKSNPIAGMSEEQIKDYANTTIKHLCLNNDILDE